MSRLLWHGFPRFDRGLSSNSSGRILIEFLHCLLGLSCQFSLALSPFFRKVLTTFDACGICYLGRCQWSSWAWRIEGEFLHVLRSDISVLPPFSCPSPLYPLFAHFALILGFLSRCAVPCIDIRRDLKGSIDFKLLSSFLETFAISHFLQLRNFHN